MNTITRKIRQKIILNIVKLGKKIPIQLSFMDDEQAIIFLNAYYTNEAAPVLQEYKFNLGE